LTSRMGIPGGPGHNTVCTCLMFGVHCTTDMFSSSAAFHQQSLNLPSGFVTVSPRRKSDTDCNCFVLHLCVIDKFFIAGSYVRFRH